MQYDIKRLLGLKIKELRIKKGMTQEELAEKIGLVERNLSKIECGRSFVTADTLANIIDALGIKPKDLFDFDYYMDEDCLKTELIDAIKNNTVNVRQLYKLFMTIK